MKCPKCKTEIPEGSQFCPKCGTDLQGPSKADERFVIQQDIGAVREGSKIVGVEYHEAGKLTSLSDDYKPQELPLKGKLAELGGLPPGSRMPFNRNEQFTGRETDLLALADKLLYKKRERHILEGSQAKVAATGWGGIGKTQLAVEFCYRYGRFFKGVHWLQSNKDVQTEIATCGLEMGIRPWPRETDEQVQLTLRFWRKDNTRLVVMDNAEDEQLIQDWLPEIGNASILLTSRRMDWDEDLDIQILPLDTLPRLESIMLLRKLAKSLKKVDIDELGELAGRLGDLPLALDLAGRYLRKRRTLTVKQYLKTLDEAGSALKHSSLLNWIGHSPTKHETSLAATFAVSWKRIHRKESKQLMYAGGFCAPHVAIPWELLYAFMKAKDDQGREQVDRCLTELEELGLMKLEEDGAVLHPLLSEFARIKNSEQENNTLPELAEVMANISFNANESGLPEQFKPLREHLQKIAEMAEKAKLEISGSLWNNLGYHLNDVAEYLKAKDFLERALQIDEAAFGPDHYTVAKDMNNLGGVLQKLGNLMAAKAAFERALKIDEAAFGSEHPNVARDLNELGSALRELGDLVGAKTAFERALQIDESFFGEEYYKVGIRVNNLGMVLRDLDDLVGAKAAFERALQIDEAAFGPDHPFIATDINNLGNVLQDLGELETAKNYYERALRIDEAAFGPNHPELATFANNLGMVQKDLGNLAGAKIAIERALQIGEVAFGKEHPNMASFTKNLGIVLQEIGDLAQAEVAYKQALNIWIKFLPENHRYVQDVKAKLAKLGTVDKKNEE
jgi:tetratricopeptide (TPR) repeat protein